MKFKEWLLTEGIIVKFGNDNAVLDSSKEIMPYEFNYQSEKTHSNYFLGAFHAHRIGYVNISNSVTHIGVIKTTPIESNHGTDFAFIKNFIEIAKKERLIPVPYKEEGNNFYDILKSTEKETGQSLELDPLKTGFTTGEHLPDFELGQSSSHQLTRGISVQKLSGSWAQFFETNRYSSQNFILKIIEIMKLAAKPLIDNDFIDFIEILNRSNMKKEIIFSKKGKNESDAWRESIIKSLSQIKYFCEKYLTNAPNFKKLLIKAINLDGATGADKWLAKYASPVDYGIPIEKLFDLNKNSYGVDPIIESFLKSLNNDERIEELEILSKNKNFYEIVYYLHYYFWENENFKNLLSSEIMFHLETLHKIIVKYGDVFESFKKEDYDYFVEEVKNYLEEILPKQKEIYRGDLKYLIELASKVNLDARLLSHLDQLYADHIEKEKKSKEEKLIRQEKISNLIPDGTYKYLMIDENKWQIINSKYINYNDSIDIGQLALDLIGNDDSLYYDAYERAEQEAMSEVEKRPSENYGEDEKEVEDDIKFDLDDFLSEIKIDEIEENTPEEEIIKIIKQNYIQDFIDWKIKQLKEKEEREIWRYEPDTESYDFQNKIEKIKEELAEEIIWDKGLVVVYCLENKVEFTISKKFWEKFKNKFKSTIEINVKEKNDDGEYYWKKTTKIIVNLMPSEFIEKYAFEWLGEI